MILSLVASILCVLAFIAFFVLWPWFFKNNSSVGVQSHQSFEAYRRYYQTRDALMESMKDLEIDFQMGKLSREDHAELKGQLAQQLVKCAEQIHQLEKADPFFQAIESDLRQMGSSS